MRISEEQDRHGHMQAKQSYAYDKAVFKDLYKKGVIFKITYGASDNWVRVDYYNKKTEQNTFKVFNGFSKELVATLISEVESDK